MTKKPFEGFPHVVESQQFSSELLEDLFCLAHRFKYECSLKAERILAGKTMISLFYEPSTRTRISFEMAMFKLGGNVISTENAGEFSSAVKGESIEDSIRVLCGYRPDVIVLRHHQEGSALKAAKISSVPIINAGDGIGQHPTQALLDLFTIQERIGEIRGRLRIAMVGDLENGRTVRSLCYLLGKFSGVQVYFVSPGSSQMKNDIKEYFNKHGVVFYLENDLKKVAPNVNVIYQTRTQKERGSVIDRSDTNQGHFNINREILNLMSTDAIIMHPLPRNEEISLDVDQDPRAVYFEQAANGLHVRMALLKLLLAPDA